MMFTLSLWKVTFSNSPAMISYRRSSLSQYIAIGRLIEESGDSLELFAQTREDEARLLQFVMQMDNQ